MNQYERAYKLARTADLTSIKQHLNNFTCVAINYWKDNPYGTNYGLGDELYIHLTELMEKIFDIVKIRVMRPVHCGSIINTSNSSIHIRYVLNSKFNDPRFYKIIAILKQRIQLPIYCNFAVYNRIEYFYSYTGAMKFLHNIKVMQRYIRGYIARHRIIRSYINLPKPVNNLIRF